VERSVTPIHSFGNPSILGQSPIVVLAGDDRIAATNAQSAEISCGSDSAIAFAFSAIGIGLLDVIGGDYAAGIGTTAQETWSQRQLINGMDDISSIRGTGIGAWAALNGRQSPASQFAISRGNFEVRDGRGDRLRLRHEGEWHIYVDGHGAGSRNRRGRDIVRPQRGRRAEYRRRILQRR
jgi:hypothetical protein